MKKSTEILEQLKNYFGAIVIGSHLLVENGLLEEEDTNDIDVIITTKGDRVESFLKDAGLTSVDTSNIEYVRYSNPDYDKPIVVFPSMLKKHPATIDQVVLHKFNRGLLDDIRQLEKVIKKRKESLNG